MAQRLFIFAVIIFISSFWSTLALAKPTLYPDNRHYYEAIAGNYDWEEARDLASSSTYLGMQGHLATLTSSAENDWVWLNLNEPLRYLLGAADRTTEGVWEWVTGEPWSFENWAWDEPNSGYGYYDEDALSFDDNGTWNDLPYIHNYWGDDDGFQYIHGYVVEYESIPVSVPAVPEPVSSILFVAGGATLVFRRYWKNRKRQ